MFAFDIACCEYVNLVEFTFHHYGIHSYRHS
uniref:Uncharacterized protein n=1 Tax=Arundo donax TaxID=35708 RepID=A0A0A8XTH4_ARUDO